MGSELLQSAGNPSEIHKSGGAWSCLTSSGSERVWSHIASAAACGSLPSDSAASGLAAAGSGGIDPPAARGGGINQGKERVRGGDEGGGGWAGSRPTNTTGRFVLYLCGSNY